VSNRNRRETAVLRIDLLVKVNAMSTKSAGSKGKKKIGKVLDEFKHGSLKSSSGQKVTDRKQAVAIALSEARSAGAKIPSKSG
jgi:hypothetical protein